MHLHIKISYNYSDTVLGNCTQMLLNVSTACFSFFCFYEIGKNSFLTFISNTCASAPKQSAVGQVMIIPPNTLYPHGYGFKELWHDKHFPHRKSTLIDTLRQTQCGAILTLESVLGIKQMVDKNQTKINGYCV